MVTVPRPFPPMGGRAWPAARQPLDPLLAGPSSSQSPLRPSHPSGSSPIHSPRSRPALPPDSGPKPVQPHQIPRCPSWDLDPPGSLWHVPPPTLSIECAFFRSGEESPLPCHRQTLVSAATLTCFLAAPQHMEFPGLCFNPPCPAGELNLHPGAAEMPLILMATGRNSNVRSLAC